MEPRQEESKKDAEPRKEVKKPKHRFQIVKLEERIAPSCSPYYHHKICGNGHHHYK